MHFPSTGEKPVGQADKQATLSALNNKSPSQTEHYSLSEQYEQPDIMHSEHLILSYL